MSRIIRGPSQEIKTFETGKARAQTTEAYIGSRFRTARVEGTITQEELEEHLQLARADAKRESGKEAEKKMLLPVTSALEVVETLMDEISKFRRDLFKEAEVEILDLIRTVSKRVVMKELSLQPDLLKEVVAKALELLEKQKKISLIVNATDHVFFMQSKPDFLERFKGIEELEILVDRSVPTGTAILKTKTVELDVKLEAMVDHLMEQTKAAEATTSTEVNDEGDHQ